MAPAADALRAIAPGMPVADPAIKLLSNRDGAVVTSGRDYLERLVAQVSAPIRWDACQQTMRETLGVTAIIELPPAGTLAGIARRELRGIEVLALKTPEDLTKARELSEAHAS